MYDTAVEAQFFRSFQLLGQAFTLDVAAFINAEVSAYRSPALFPHL